ncbi:MAG: excinuclease ABC subunit UvrA, partial [Myxococcota bacterium]
RLKMKEGLDSRLADSIETAAGLSGGIVEIVPLEGESLRFSERFADLEHGVAFPEVTPSLFSFNSPHGACPVFGGLGEVQHFDPRLIVDEEAGLGAGAIRPWRRSAKLGARLAAVAEHFGVEPATPWRALPSEVHIVVLEGSGDEAIGGQPFEGVRPWLQRRVQERATKRAAAPADDEVPRDDTTGYAVQVPCTACEGTRLRPEARLVKVGEHDLPSLCALPLSELRQVVASMSFSKEHAEVAAVVLDKVRGRLAFLEEVGLGYLTLSRRTMTLSGGEAQRIRLATQVGAALVGVTYVLDEPSIGLHQRDNDRLIATLLRLRNLGNTLIVVEHDADTMRAADWLVDMGPGAGRHGGTVVAAGTVEAVMADERSRTGAYLAGRMQIEVPAKRRPATAGSVTITGARGHNLQRVNARIPLSVLTCVTGVSGSGKSSLIIDTLLPEASRLVGGGARFGLAHDRIDGLSRLDKVIHVDQSPIGRSPKSNPATYTGMLADVRAVFAQLPDAKVRGFTPARFSFNVKGGRCEACGGEGQRRIEMHFLPDLYVECSVCNGQRYNRDTLAVTMRGKSIADVLAMTVSDAFDFFVAHPAIRAKLEVLRDVGLGYIGLGQSALTLSGGEAQRIKLAKELAKKSTGSTLFVLDEPTTGLHASDVRQLLAVLQRLVDEGNTVVVIEHDLDVIKSADHVIDIGPEGGTGGGTVVVAGTPEVVAACEASHTGRYLRAALPR